jgi:predicted ribosomally synthesized peptide with nif11-like leader
MSQETAVAFLDRVESDEDFAKELASLREDPPAVLEKIRGAGFDVQPEEVREAFLERYGAELTPEQMEQIAAGVDPGTVVAGIAGVGVLIGLAAIAGGF